MNVLILSTVRSGSSRLLESISSYYNQEGIFEPTTPQYKKDFNPSEDISITKGTLAPFFLWSSTHLKEPPTGSKIF